MKEHGREEGWGGRNIKVVKEGAQRQRMGGMGSMVKILGVGWSQQREEVAIDLEFSYHCEWPTR